MEERPWRNKELMHELYHDQKMSFSDISEHLDCGWSTVQRWIGRHGIETRSTGEATSIANSGKETSTILHNADSLEDYYIERGWKAERIAEEIGSSTRTVIYWLNKHGIERRGPTEYRLSHSTRSKLNDREWLKKSYEKEGKSIPELAAELDCSVRTIANYLVKHGVDRRPMSKAVGSGSDHASWKGGNGDYGPNWPQKRQETLERDGWECQVCSLDNKQHLRQHNQELHVHHIQPRHTFVENGRLDHERANKLNNLITLCRECHHEWEGIPVRPQTRE